MIHSSYFKPRIYPVGGTGASAEIDRLQGLSGSTNLSRTKINEIGRDGTVGWKVGIPQVSLTANQLEYGSLEFWNKITNTTATAITLNDFKTSSFDLAGYKTDDNGTFLGTVWYPKQRVSGWGLNISGPDALIERSFSFVGEDEIVFTDNNKYLIYLESTASGAGHMIVIGSGGFANYPDPVDDPDSSGSSQILRVIRVRSGTATELVSGTDYTWNSSTNLLNIPASAASDLYKVTYSASSYITGGDPFTDNDTDLAGISAENASIYLETSNYVYRVQSLAIDVSFNRQDVKEIGNSEVVSRGITDKTVKITIGRILETYETERLLRGASSSTYGKYDVRNFQDNLKLTVKIYNNKDKDTFLIGYSFTDLAPTSTDTGVPTKDYVTRNVVLEGESATITSVEGSL